MPFRSLLVKRSVSKNTCVPVFLTTIAKAAGLPEPEFRGIDSQFCEKWNSQYVQE